MVNQKDVWQIDMVGRSSGERLNYATQKPEALLSRIIDAVTDEGDLTADFFCGSGTLAAVAARKGRRCISTDISSLAVANALKRPLRAGCCCCLSVSPSDSGTVKYPADKIKNSLTAVRRNGEIELIRYEADLTGIPLRVKDEEQNARLQEIARRDPFSFMDFWGYGTLKQGVFRFQNAVFREKGKRLNTKTAAEASRSSDGKFLIFAADIFGNIVFSEPSG